MKSLFHFDQNNSRGKFHPPAVHILVEAPTLEDAIKLTAPHFTLCGDTGMYADYDDCGCCPCCGHRWDAPYSGKPMDAEEIAARFTPEAFACLRGKIPRLALITPDGAILTSANAKDLKKIRNYCQP